MYISYRAIPAALALTAIGITAHAQEALGGDAGLACEAILCLSTASPPQECNRALRRYFSISHRRLAETIRRRNSFLRLCPSSQQTVPVAPLLEPALQAEGRCDAASLNASQRRPTGSAPDAFAVSNRMPAYCEAYLAQAYSDWAQVLPRYVGVPGRGGHWVPARDHARAQKAWQARAGAEGGVRIDTAVH